MPEITEEIRDEPVNPPPPFDEEPNRETEERRTPLPKFQLFLVVLIQFTEPVTATVIYPFVNQFVRDTGITQGDDKRTGYYAGIIESALFCAEAATVFQWGWLSDRFGRRPILLLGPLGLTFAMLSFGYSTTFWPMVWSRWMQGVFNGNIGVSKTVMMELTDASNIGDAVAMLPLMWSVGSTIAPTMGGVLSNPAARWPNVFGKITLLKEHPYLLPCIAASFISFFSFLIGFLGFKETHHVIKSEGKPNNNKRTVYYAERPDAGSIDPLLCHPDPPSYGTGTSTRPSSTSIEPSLELCPNPENRSTHTPTFRSVLTSSGTIRLLLANYAFWTFMDMSYSVLMPLIYSTSIKNGGLGLTPYQIGLTMGIWGFLNAFIQINLLGKMIRKYGGSRVYKFTYPCYFVAFSTFPISTYLARRNGGVSFEACIPIVIQLVSQFGSLMGYGAIQVLVAESTPPTVLGSINGLFQMTGSLMRTIAPTIASSLFSLSLQSQILHGNLVYAVLLSVALCGIVVGMALPDRSKSQTSTQ